MLWKIVEYSIGALMLVSWVWCMLDWVRGGARFPRWVHALAMAMLVVGALAALYALSLGAVRVAVMSVAVPPLVAYFAWLWAFGPWSQRRNR